MPVAEKIFLPVLNMLVIKLKLAIMLDPFFQIYFFRSVFLLYTL